MLSLVLAAAVASAPTPAAVELAQLDKPRPSLIGPVALVASGALLSLAGTGLGLLGLSILALQPSCAAPVDCEANLRLVGAPVLVGGVVLLAGGLILAIVGHIEWATRAEQRAAVAPEVPAMVGP